MSLHKSNSKSNTFTSSKKSFFKPSDQNDMLETQYSSYSTEQHDQSQYSCGNDLFFQEDCLMKLKDQRLMIEELTYLYQKTQQQLKKQQQKTRKLQIKTQNHEQLKLIKLKHLSMCKQFQSLQQQKSILQNQLQNMKKKLNQLSSQHNRMLKLSSFQKRKLQQQSQQQYNRYEEVIKNKNDEITRNINVFQTKEKEHLMEINKLNEVINDLKEDIGEIKRESQMELQQMMKQVMKRDSMMEKLKKSMENMKDENCMLRNQLRQTENQFLYKQKEWLNAQDDLVHQINSLKRKNHDLDHRIAQIQYLKSKLQTQTSQQSQTITVLNHSLKSLQSQSKQTLNTLTHSYEQKIHQYKNQIQQLKQSIQELLQVKNIFNKQNEILKEKLTKDDQERKKRRRMIRSELREIEMIDNAVKRVV